VRIPRPVRRKPLFKRRTSPPPAARKLLLASLLSGLILLAMLAVVFIPRGLVHENLPTLPRVALTLNRTSGTTVFVVVSAVSLVRPLAEYNATYANDTRRFGSIASLQNGAADPDLSFRDVDRDGNLTVGDEFRVVVYRGDAFLRVSYLPGRAIVGYWPTPP
jgi:hypothetical protein